VIMFVINVTLCKVTVYINELHVAMVYMISRLQ
jgi:hypothetical protein